MKTIITSNWRPLRRALCTLLLGIAAATVALCSAPSDPLVAMLEVLGWSAEDPEPLPKPAD